MRLRFFINALQRSCTSGAAALMGASFLWAFSFGLIGTFLTNLNPLMVACVRLTLSFLLFLPLLRPRGIEPRLLLQLLGVGAVQYGIMYVAYIQSYQYLKGHEVALFTIFTPLYIALLHRSGAWRSKLRILLAAGLAVVGAGVIVYRMPNRSVALQGVLLLQIANFAFAFGQVGYRHVMQHVPVPVRDRDLFAILFAGGMVLSGVVVVATGGWRDFQISSTQVKVLLYLGLVPSGLGFFLWNRGARLVKHGPLAVMNNIKIPLAVFVTIVWFDESCDWTRLLLGGGVMLLGLWLSESGLSGTLRNGRWRS